MKLPKRTIKKQLNQGSATGSDKGPFIGMVKSGSIWKKIKLTRPLAIVLLASTVVAAILMIWNSQRSSPQTTTACAHNPSILQRSVKGLEDGSLATDPNIDQDIKTLDNYTADPNCTLVLSHYYTIISDYENANKYFEILSSTENYDERIAAPIRFSNPSATNYVALGNKINFLKEVTQNTGGRLQGPTAEIEENLTNNNEEGNPSEDQEL